MPNSKSSTAALIFLPHGEEKQRNYEEEHQIGLRGATIDF
jgi:hypothetical protein